MKLALFLLPPLLVGCSTVEPYRVASRSLLELTPADSEFNPRYPNRYAYFCWVAARADLDADISSCSVPAADSAVAVCVRELSTAKTPPVVEAAARLHLVECMREKGWRRVLMEVLS